MQKHSDPATVYFAVYGANGHRQKINFEKSFVWDFSNEYFGARILNVRCSDVTGTNAYVIVGVTRDTCEECLEEMEGQLSDGLFENCRTGTVLVWTDKKWQPLLQDCCDWVAPPDVADANAFGSIPTALMETF